MPYQKEKMLNVLKEMERLDALSPCFDMDSWCSIDGNCFPVVIGLSTKKEEIDNTSYRDTYYEFEDMKCGTTLCLAGHAARLYLKERKAGDYISTTSAAYRYLGFSEMPERYCSPEYEGLSKEDLVITNKLWEVFYSIADFPLYEEFPEDEKLSIENLKRILAHLDLI